MPFTIAARGPFPSSKPLSHTQCFFRAERSSRRTVTTARAAELIKHCNDEPETNGEVRGAIEELCGKLCGRKLGGRFKHFKRRNFGGTMLDKAGEDRTKTNRWAAFPVGSAARPSPSEPASPASPADDPPNAGKAGNAGAVSDEEAPAPKKPAKKRTYGNDPNRGKAEGGAA